MVPSIFIIYKPLTDDSVNLTRTRIDSDSDLTRSTDELANNQECCCVVTVYFSEVKTNLARAS